MIQLLRKCLYIFQLKVIPQSVKNLVLCGYWNHINCKIPSLTRTLSRVKVGLMGGQSVTMSHNLSATTAQNLPPWSA